MPQIRLPLPAELPESEIIDIGSVVGSYRAGDIDMICVLGPTASGKTKYAVRLAQQIESLPETGLKCEIISADSRQVYKGMDIGTGKDLCEYQDIPYHLIDIQPAGARYNVYEYQKDFLKVYRDIRGRGVLPILCGGTGLYIEAASCRYDFHLSEPAVDVSMLPQSTYYIGTLVDRRTRNARIDARLKARLEEGMVDEIRGLLESGVPVERLLLYGLEYKFVTQYVTGELSYDEMVRHLSVAIHQFAKRQMTWFRGMERDGIVIHWTEV